MDQGTPGGDSDGAGDGGETKVHLGPNLKYNREIQYSAMLGASGPNALPPDIFNALPNWRRPHSPMLAFHSL